MFLADRGAGKPIIGSGREVQEDIGGLLGKKVDTSQESTAKIRAAQDEAESLRKTSYQNALLQTKNRAAAETVRWHNIQAKVLNEKPGLKRQDQEFQLWNSQGDDLAVLLNAGQRRLDAIIASGYGENSPIAADAKAEVDAATKQLQIHGRSRPKNVLAPPGPPSGPGLPGSEAAGEQLGKLTPEEQAILDQEKAASKSVAAIYGPRAKSKILAKRKADAQMQAGKGSIMGSMESTYNPVVEGLKKP